MGNRQKVVVNMLHYITTIFRFFTNYSRLAGWLVVLRARARADLKSINVDVRTHKPACSKLRLHLTSLRLDLQNLSYDTV